MELKNILNYLEAFVSSDFGITMISAGIFLCHACFSRSLFFITLSFLAYVFDITPLLPALAAFCFSVFICFAQYCIGTEELNLNNGHLQKEFTPESLEEFLLFSKFVHEHVRERSFFYLMRCYWNFKTARIISYHYFSRQQNDLSFHKWNLISGSIWAICITGIGYATASFFWNDSFLYRSNTYLFGFAYLILIERMILIDPDHLWKVYLRRKKTIEVPRFC